MQTLRSIDLQTRSADLDVFVYIATDKTPLLCQNPAVETRHPPAMAPTVRGGTHHRATVMTIHCVPHGHTVAKCPQLVVVIHPMRYSHRF